MGPKNLSNKSFSKCLALIKNSIWKLTFSLTLQQLFTVIFHNHTNNLCFVATNSYISRCVYRNCAHFATAGNSTSPINSYSNKSKQAHTHFLFYYKSTITTNLKTIIVLAENKKLPSVSFQTGRRSHFANTFPFGCAIINCKKNNSLCVLGQSTHR